MRKCLARCWTLVVALTLFALIWWGYKNSPLNTPKASPDWSKGLPVGVASLNQPVAIQAGNGKEFLVWVDLSNRLRFAKLDERAEVLMEETLDLFLRSPRQPQLLLGPEGRLHLTWLDGKGGKAILSYVQLDKSGEVISSPLSLSPPEEEVERSQMALDFRGEVEVFWSSASGGIYHLTIDPRGKIKKQASLMIPGGLTPNIQVDNEGLFHITWLEESTPNIYEVNYATFDPESGVIGEATGMAKIFIRAGRILEGPTLGLDIENGYILWSVKRPFEIGSVVYYVSFPLDNPKLREMGRLRMADVRFPSSPYPVSGQWKSLLVALSLETSTGAERQFQVGLAVFNRGEFMGHQVISASKDASLKPSIVFDEELNLHMAWIDTAGFGRYNVIYASTSPRIKDALNKLTVKEVVDSVLGEAMKLLLVIGFAPLIVVWSFVPLAWLIVFYLLTGRQELSEPGTWIALSVAFLLQVAAMVGFSFVGGLFFKWVLPVVLAGAAILATFTYLRYTKSKSVFGAFFAFALIHGLLRLAIHILVYL